LISIASVNAGDADAGDADTGDADAGDADAGDADAGDADTGDADTGDADTGDADTGDADAGDADAGDAGSSVGSSADTSIGSESATGSASTTTNGIRRRYRRLCSCRRSFPNSLARHVRLARHRRQRQASRRHSSLQYRLCGCDGRYARSHPFNKQRRSRSDVAATVDAAPPSCTRPQQTQY